MSTDTTSTVEEVAFGAARAAREVAADPIGSARSQVKGLKRRGAPTARKVNRQLSEQIDAATAPAKDVVKGVAQTAGQIAADLMPERIVLLGLQLVKVQAKRQDTMGDVAKRALRVFNGSFKTIARVANRFERASELPVRRPAPQKTRRSTRRATTRRSAAA
jgi:phage-related minor tail protein